MKLVPGGHLVLRGRVPVTSGTGFTKRINFFDGDFSHGYSVTKFVVGTDAANAGSDVIGKLMSGEPDDPQYAFWNWSDNKEIAWAAFTMDATVTPGEGWNPGNSLVVRDNLIIEDLYITVRSRDVASPEVFYYIELDKYALEPFEGPLNMVANRSQG